MQLGDAPAAPSADINNYTGLFRDFVRANHRRVADAVQVAWKSFTDAAIVTIVDQAPSSPVREICTIPHNPNSILLQHIVDELFASHCDAQPKAVRLPLGESDDQKALLCAYKELAANVRAKGQLMAMFQQEKAALSAQVVDLAQEVSVLGAKNASLSKQLFKAKQAAKSAETELVACRGQVEVASLSREAAITTSKEANSYAKEAERRAIAAEQRASAAEHRAAGATERAKTVELVAQQNAQRANKVARDADRYRKSYLELTNRVRNRTFCGAVTTRNTPCSMGVPCQYHENLLGGGY